jgi:hypothetical protein
LASPEVRSTQDSLGLSKSLNLLITGFLTDIKVLQDEVTALMQVSGLVHVLDEFRLVFLGSRYLPY